MLNHKILLAAILLTATCFANAAEHTVKLLTSDDNRQTMIMEPGYIKIDKGDTINFIPSDPTHNAESVSIPSGAEKFKGLS